MLRSIQGRMLLLSAVAILAALGIAGWAIAGVLERVVTEGIDRRLDAEIALLASTVAPDGQVDRARLAARAGALEAGRGWTWRIDGPDGAIGSADPDVIVVMCCGYGLDENAGFARDLLGHPQASRLRAVRQGQLWAVDANAHFSRPSLGVVRGARVLAALLAGQALEGASVRVDAGTASA